MIPLVSKVDFHVHSTVSDGSFSPEGVLELALRASIGVLSITDHDAIEGFDRAAERLRERGPTARPALRLVAGVELSTSFEGEEVHILGYFPSGVPDALRAYVGAAERARLARREGPAPAPLGNARTRERQLGLFASEQDRVREALLRLDLSNLTPLKALNLLHEWKALVERAPR